MASQFSTNSATSTAKSINDIPKLWTFTSKLPPDSLFPTPAASHKTARDQIGPRQVRDALFTWVRPQPSTTPDLLATSPAALRDLNIDPDSVQTPDFVATVAGNKLQGWDEETLEGGYPWAQCYGGFQFGQWAGQLGDGRAISLFETTNEKTGKRYELQLKGAGLTPYSRFADGKAVLRSSIREFVVSEALHALGIPSTRALSLTLLPGERVRRETTEPGAIVARFAESWLRIGNFDILRARGDRALIRTLATYVAEDVFGGWETLPGRLDDPDKATESSAPKRGVPADAVEGPDESAENRFTRLYREIVRRNASTVAKWQAYGFMNGVLNTDNTSLFGLSIDFGPFAFMDNFDPSYTPNHDDYMLRYSYRNQPSIIWWNLVRLGESLGESIGAGSKVDDPKFVEDGVKEEEANGIIERAEKIIMQVGEEYKAVFLGEYKKLMTARFGLKNHKESDFDELFSGVLDTMEALELDFNLFFRRLSSVRIDELKTEEARRDRASVFFYSDGVTGIGGEAEGRKRVGEWLGKWRQRILEDWGDGKTVSDEQDKERMQAMKKVNPSFIPRGWILDEVIRRVEKDDERDILDRVMHMALHPFEETWAGRTFDGKEYKGDIDEETRWISDVPKTGRALQCSCSS
ncbi:UPF0061-domain-containing protein [Annulohypoxylon maeteangense]|uniref:UPF0061-domain-containing protein n=1 Tax=Annulohypoxylon maeteangense TaxID=1927788 RepID=UPI0020075B0F|nr:UPF0061-domain-containing protein [Annulohypoxylon maeteangense]KAI0884777.1 UPF0061-domain-containing protein [Annulohypoxylon maeteangense]